MTTSLAPSECVTNTERRIATPGVFHEDHHGQGALPEVEEAR
jgi:hypothetical protein